MLSSSGLRAEATFPVSTRRLSPVGPSPGHPGRARWATSAAGACPPANPSPGALGGVSMSSLLVLLWEPWHPAWTAFTGQIRGEVPTGAVAVQVHPSGRVLGEDSRVGQPRKASADCWKPWDYPPRSWSRGRGGWPAGLLLTCPSREPAGTLLSGPHCPLLAEAGATQEASQLK